MRRKERRELAFEQAKKEMKTLGVPRRQLIIFVRKVMKELDSDWDYTSPYGSNWA